MEFSRQVVGVAKELLPLIASICLVYADKLVALCRRRKPLPRPVAADPLRVVFSRPSKRNSVTQPSFVVEPVAPAALGPAVEPVAPAPTYAAQEPTKPPPNPPSAAVVLPVANAIKQVTEQDNRLPVKQLLAENAVAISALRTALLDHPLFRPREHDELWLLRYVLSHKKSVAAAAKAARYTLQWRQEHAMDQLAAELRATPGERGLASHPAFVLVHKAHVQPGGIHLVQPHPQRGPLLIGTMTLFDYTAAMAIPRVAYLRYIQCINEWSFNECDRVTRETGLLTKQARFVQCKNFRLGSLNREWLALDGQVSKEMEDCYPQHLGQILVLDPPGWALIMWRAVKMLFPARMVEKVDLLPLSSRKELERRVLRFMSFADLPASHGGLREPYPCPVHGI